MKLSSTKLKMNKYRLPQSIFLALFIVIFGLFPSSAQAGFKEILFAFAGDVKASEIEPEGELFNKTENTFPVAGNRAPLRTLTVVATAYSSDPAQTDSTPCIPAMWKYNLCDEYLKTGTEDTIAANFLPLGTQVRFPDMYGDKVFMVRDRMNERYNYQRIGYYRIDFYSAATGEDGKMDNKAAKQKAKEFGVKRGLKMEVVAAAQ